MSDQTTAQDVMVVNELQRERIAELEAQRDALLEAALQIQLYDDKQQQERWYSGELPCDMRDDLDAAIAKVRGGEE